MRSHVEESVVPEAGELVVETDAAMAPQTGMLALAAVADDWEVTRVQTAHSSTWGELAAIELALAMASVFDVHRLRVLSDCKSVVDSINGGPCVAGLENRCIEVARQLADSEGRWSLAWAPRGGNRAHAVARRALRNRRVESRSDEAKERTGTTANASAPVASLRSLPACATSSTAESLSRAGVFLLDRRDASDAHVWVSCDTVMRPDQREATLVLAAPFQTVNKNIACSGADEARYASVRFAIEQLSNLGVVRASIRIADGEVVDELSGRRIARPAHRRAQLDVQELLSHHVGFEMVTIDRDVTRASRTGRRN
jgi:ribonuclease HI